MQKFRILHSADWHLGKLLYDESLMEDQAYALSQMVDAAKSHKPDLFVIAGDIYDRPIPPAEAGQVLGDFFAQMTQLGVPVLGIPGNHDSPLRLSYAAELLSGLGLHMRCRPDASVLEPVKLSARDGRPVDVFALPWVEIQHVRAICRSADISFESQDDFGALLGKLLAAMLARMREGAIPVLVAHLFVQGGITSDSERTSLVGGLGQVDAAVFEGFAYTALGHLHRSQSPAPGARYSGSPVCYSSSEIGGTKSILCVDIPTGQRSQLDLFGEETVCTEIPLKALHPLEKIHFDGSNLDAFLAGIQPGRYAQSRVILQVTSEAMIPGLHHMVKSTFPGLVNIEFGVSTAGTPADATLAAADSQEVPDSLDAQVFDFFEVLNGEPPDEDFVSSTRSTIERWENSEKNK